MNWETLLCLGDSITIGSRSYLGYPEYCGNKLSIETNKIWNVYNHAVAGYTTIDLARSIDQNLSNIKTCKPEIATILIGTNDLKRNTSLDTFKIVYEQVITKVRLIVGNNNIVLIEIPKLMEGVMLPYRLEMNLLVDQYNNIINSIAKQRNLLVCKLDTQTEYFYDGVHLNEEGSKIIGDQIAAYILKLRRN